MAKPAESRVLVVSLFAPYTANLTPQGSTPTLNRARRSPSTRQPGMRRPYTDRLTISAEAQLTPSRAIRPQAITAAAGLTASSGVDDSAGPIAPPRLAKLTADRLDSSNSNSVPCPPVDRGEDFACPDATAQLFGPTGPDCNDSTVVPPLDLAQTHTTSLTHSKREAARVAFAAKAKPRPPQSEITELSQGGRLASHPATVLDRMYTTPKPAATKDASPGTVDGASSPWSIEPLNVGNIGLFNAINICPRSATNRLFVGTLGVSTDGLEPDARHSLTQQLYTQYDTCPVYVPDSELDGHYNKFCKQALWPMFHYILPEYPQSMGWEPDAWEACLAVHRRFADAVAHVYQEGDVVWINDYHLLLLPGMIRDRLPNAKVGFFLHVPFPSSEVFRCLHVRKEILRGLLGADLIGFQTVSFARHFTQTCSRILSYETSPNQVFTPHATVSVGIFPIGIDPDALRRKKDQPAVKAMVAKLREKYAGKKVIIGRDKLDHVKGVRQKLLAFEKFLSRYPEWHGKVVMIQIALSTAEHNEIHSQVTDVVTRINSKFGSISYQPIVFLHQDIPFSQYLALMTFANAFIITSLRDGMNLTSHEYILCQEDYHNPLIISEFAGTYGLLGAAAIRVNPWNVVETSEAIHEALVMPKEEKQCRWTELYHHITTASAQSWVTGFIDEVEKSHRAIQHRYSIDFPRLDARHLAARYRSATHRLLVLNYDSLVSAPTEAVAVIRVLSELLSDPGNQVYLLSNLTADQLTCQVTLPGNAALVGAVAENGCLIRYQGTDRWEWQTQPDDMPWRDPVLKILNYYQERTPGSRVETKEVALVWHYGSADNPSYGVWQAAECQNHIEDALSASYPIHVTRGHQCLEVTPKDTTKASAIPKILSHLEATAVGQQAAFPDFILAVGNDRSDEDVFTILERCQDGTLWTASSVPASQQGSPLREQRPSLPVADDTQPTGEARGQESPSPTIATCVVGTPFVKAQYFAPSAASVLECLQQLTDRSN
ncbi:Trehalose-6-P synthase/phosphatase complex subunit [Dimargaris verticillata]|uniref:Trehalose-6-P synthase/phosphatase complex subunit n=1 Tax=Dimargaris verticillata TaxID=2761393 RepID=A0A9W8BBT6_9FUNG|nr:Trehalose-6-P synthase/phosphatase complex subunit [Dimargaris verticillata]